MYCLPAISKNDTLPSVFTLQVAAALAGCFCIVAFLRVCQRYQMFTQKAEFWLFEVVFSVLAGQSIVLFLIMHKSLNLRH